MLSSGPQNHLLPRVLCSPRFPFCLQLAKVHHTHHRPPFTSEEGRGTITSNHNRDDLRNRACLSARWSTMEEQPIQGPQLRGDTT